MYKVSSISLIKSKSTNKADSIRAMEQNIADLEVLYDLKSQIIYMKLIKY